MAKKKKKKSKKSRRKTRRAKRSGKKVLRIKKSKKKFKKRSKKKKKSRKTKKSRKKQIFKSPTQSKDSEGNTLIKVSDSWSNHAYVNNSKYKKKYKLSIKENEKILG